MARTSLNPTYNNIQTPIQNDRDSQTQASQAPSKLETGEMTLAEGSRLKAEVSDFLGKDLKLRLSDGSVIQARTSTATMLAIGQEAEFEVIRSNTDQLLLRLMNTDTVNSEASMAGRALDAAGLPHTEENLSLINTLLDNRLPVNADSLKLLSHQMAVFKDTPVTALAKMNSYALPVNRSTIAQYEAYLNYEHSLLPQLETLQSALENEELSGLLKEYGFTPEELAKEDALSNAQSAADKLSGSSTENTSVVGGHTETTGNVLAFKHNLTFAQGLGAGSTGENASANAPVNSAGTPINSAGTPINSTGTPISSSTAPLSAEAMATEGAVSSEIMLPSAPAEAESNAPLNHVTLDSSVFNSQTKGTFEDEALTMKVSSFKERWTLTPEKFAQEGEIEKVFERLNSDLEKLKEVLKKIQAKTQNENADLQKLVADTSKAADGLKENLEFMNLLNRFFPYVQLPLRMDDRFTQGELFVYRRKKMKQNDESVSVLLHLDMDNLGPTDIYLNLAGQNLAAKFYLENEGITELFKKYIPELTDRLQAKGFVVNYDFLPRSEAASPVQDFLAAGEPSDIKRYKFDCRA